MGVTLLKLLKKTPLLGVIAVLKALLNTFGIFFALVIVQVLFVIVSVSMLRTTLIFDFFQVKGKKIINSLSYIIGALLFTGIAIGGWTDMIKGC